MSATQRFMSPLHRIASGALILGWLCTPAHAQVGVLGGETGPTLMAPAVVPNDRPDAFAGPSRDYTALVAGDWLVYPTFFAGAVFDSNPNQVSSGARSSAGLRLVPSVLAETTNGISKTSLYGMADGRVYTNQSNGNADAVAARAGVIENYELAPDLLFIGQGDFTHQRDLFSTFGIDHSVTTLNPTGIGLAPVTNPISYNQFTGSGQIQKTFDRAFFNLGASVIDINYDHSSGVTAPSPDGVDTTETARGGFWINPLVYAYLEGSIDQRNYSTSSLSSDGYRTIAGLGSDQIGLFRGEIYGGYQSESYNSGNPLGTVNAPVYGGRLFYYPLPELTLSGSVDRTIGASLLTNTPGTIGTSTQLTSALAQASYSLMQAWTASGRFGFIHTDYVNTSRSDDSWLIGGTFTYSVWQNLGVTLDYEHLQLSSNVPLQGFDRDVVTLGLTYKY